MRDEVCAFETYFANIRYSKAALFIFQVASGSEKGKQLSEIMKKGDLVSNEEVLGLLEIAMGKVGDGCKGFLIDGYN